MLIIRSDDVRGLVAVLPEAAVETGAAGICDRYRTPVGAAPEIMVSRAVAEAEWVA